MKRQGLINALLAVASTAALAAGLAACGDSSSSSTSAGTQTKPAGPPLKVSVDAGFPPFGLKDGTTITGFDADVAKMLGEKLGRPVQLTDIKFVNSIPAVQSGRVDMAFVGGFIDNKERRGQMDLVTYYNSLTGFVVPAGNPKGVRNFADLCGLRAASVKGAYLLDSLKKAGKQCEKDGKPGVKVSAFNDTPAAIVALKAGRLDAVTDALAFAEYYKQKTDGIDAVKAEDADPYIGAFGVNKGDPALSQAAAKAYAAALASGEVAKIGEKWGVTGEALLPDTKLNGKPVAP